MADDNQSSPHTIVYRSTGKKTFKACRTCRLQKARCIINTASPPCRRCRATGRDCVFEEIPGSSTKSESNPRKRSLPFQFEEEDSNCRLDRLEQEVAQLRQSHNDLVLCQQFTARAPLSPYPSTKAAESCRGTHPLLTENASSPEDLGRLHLDAPITAVHAMSSTSIPPTQSPVSVCSDEGKTRLESRLRYDDVISTGLITESHARKSFQLYMANANVFLPLFDPTIDTFDTMRQDSPFCLTVILAVALRVDSASPDARAKGEKCLRAAQDMAMKSLFTSSARLETVQGMLLLAANSDSNWFAVSHAYQMGQDMGLFDLLERGPAIRSDAEAEDQTQQTTRNIGRLLRTAWVLHQVEQEVGSGTARKSRGHLVVNSSLAEFLRCHISTTHYMRIVSNVQIVHLRGRLLQELERHDSLFGTVRQRIRQLDEEISIWFNRWDLEYQGREFYVASFHRSSLRLQRDYAFIIVCSTIMSKLGSRGSTHITADISEVIDTTLERSTRILSFIVEDNDYKWYLPWAPTYSALFPAFTAVLTFRLARFRPDTTDWKHLQYLFSAAADILEEYPYRHFSRIIRDVSKLAERLALASICRRECTPDRTNELFNQRNHETPAGLLGGQEPRPFRHPATTSSTCTSGYDGNLPSDSAPWAPAPLPQYLFEDGDASLHASMPLQPEMPSLPGTPGYMLDFNSFVTSIQAAPIDMEEYIRI
ncbi:hypothetical protein BDW59DRAFT_160327 [Aspergillus cavernicola]|uniref:Zn(2)-C6 fungal-type domain-containing protein n=1 Tax=Aspergillus cavernicola TaxID=176166 RepID=A0ABR4IHZ1_9EURO